MAGDMPELNTDSFVDTIANTVGILIVLVVISIATYSIRQIGTDPKLRGLYSTTRDMEKAVKVYASQISVLTREVAGLEATNQEELIALESAKKRYQNASDTLNTKKEESKSLGMSLSNLRRKRKAGLASIERAKQLNAEAAKGFSPEDLEYLRGTTLEGIQADLATLTKEAEDLQKSAEEAVAEAQQNTQRIAVLEQEEEKYEGLIDRLRELGLAEVIVQDPMVPFAKTKRGIWVECFAAEGEGDAAPVGRVRVISDKTYKKVGDELTPVFAGETKPELKRKGSEYRKFLAAMTDQQKTKYFIHFFVQPDAYPAFRAARALAAEEGWEVRWDPMSAGTNPMAGRPGRPK